MLAKDLRIGTFGVPFVEETFPGLKEAEDRRQNCSSQIFDNWGSLMPRLRIAVISDLHIGDAARAKDLQIPKGKGKPKKAGETDHDDFIARFREFVSKRPVPMVADVLIIPGDITNKGTPAEFDLAARVVHEVSESLKVKADNIFFIPGNHDVDWSVIGDEAPHPLRLGQRFDPFVSFAQKIRKASNLLASAPYFAVASSPSYYIVGYNSAWHDQPRVPAAHHGRVDSEHMRQLAAHIRATPPAVGAVRIFVVHHHPYQYMDFLRDWDDFSIMQNAEALHDLLAEFKFDILIHGHKHYPNFNTQTTNSGHPIAILCAGSFCRILDSRWNGIVANQFHLIDVEGRDPRTGAICGKLNSWAYLASGGWDKSYHTGETERARRRGTGIEHIKAFGFYSSPPELKALIEQIVDEKFSGNALLSESELYSAEPRLNFVPAEALEAALREFTANSPYDLLSSDGQRYLVRGAGK